MRRVRIAVSLDALYGMAIVALSAGYYAQYLNSGFNFSDAGNYAQICYELFLGRDPSDLVISYGILWFKIGEFLFDVFGVSYSLVKLLFFACITLTNALVFYTVSLATGSRLLAFGAALAAMLVPAFPATSFYALCVMLNVAAQMRLAHGTPRVWHAALAGAILSFTFQIRPDFGYAFVVPLIAVLTLISFDARGRAEGLQPAIFGHTLGLSALWGFLGVLALGLATSVVGGYTGVFLQQFLNYPAMMAGYFFDGIVHLLTGSTTSAENAAGLLVRPSIADIFSEDRQLGQLALLIYLPVFVLSAFVVVHVPKVFRLLKGGCVGALAPTLVALSAAAATLPHYFFYRPDMSHIANFMPGYIVVAAVFASQMYAVYRDRELGWIRFSAAGVMLVLVAHISFYLWAGLHSPATGSIAVAAERTEGFSAENGVEVRVTSTEKADLTFLRDVIAQNSETGEAIVCVPYCPGVAFMTERRMLLPNFYVDDTLLISQPSWLSNAISLTASAKPAVVIVIDWAINGTEQSRFVNWAAPYINLVEGLSRAKVVHGSITAYLL